MRYLLQFVIRFVTGIHQGLLDHEVTVGALGCVDDVC